MFSNIPWADLIASYGYWIVFVVIVCESAGIPCPGETILIGASVLAGSSVGGLNIGLVIGVAALAAILGDNIGFWVGRRYGFPLLLKHGPKIGMSERRIKLAQYLFWRHGGKIVLFGRFTPLLRAFAAVLAGANAYPPGHFLAYNAAGGILWAALIGLGGFFIGKSVEHAIGPFGVAMLILLLGSGYLGWRFIRKHEHRLSEEAEREMPGPLADRVSFRHRTTELTKNIAT